MRSVINKRRGVPPKSGEEGKSRGGSFKLTLGGERG